MAQTVSTSATTQQARSLNSQVVLDEDEYTEALSKIIARDFFPSLAHLDAANNYLGTPSGDHLTDSTPVTTQSGAPRHLVTPTPVGLGVADTPFSRRDELSTQSVRYNTSLSLDDFQARYTSEDNSSFTQILDDENRKRKERWAWAWAAQRRVEGQKAKELEGREKMLIEAPEATGVRETFMLEAPATVKLITDTPEEERSQREVVKVPASSEGTAEVDVMAPKKDTRSTRVDGWNFKTRNSLMFPPDADISPYDMPADAAEAGNDAKLIKHRNTQFPGEASSSSHSPSIPVPPSPTRSRIDAAITGTPYHPTTNTLTLVPNLPSPTPSSLGPVSVGQLMTWGTLNATPRIISDGDDSELPPPNTPFHLPAPTTREVISRKLSSNASKSLRVKAALLGLPRIGGLGRTPGSSSRKRTLMGPPDPVPQKANALGNLTPAARSLLDRSTKVNTTPRRGDPAILKKDLNQVRWTPVSSPGFKRR